MKEYILFLDESKNTPPNKYFSLGGCIIEKTNYENNIIPYINKLKKDVFGNADIILHESEMRRVQKEEYAAMRNAESRNKFWDGMKNLFNNYEISVLSAVINPEECKNKYRSRYLNDEYFIAMQIIMENYAHFLEQNNGQGSIIIESRNQKDDVKLQEHFNALKKHGTLFLSRHSLQKNIGTISFYMKSANIIGLQIADFIPNAMKKHITNQKQSKPSIATEIYNKAYDGAYDDKNRFGIKKIL